MVETITAYVIEFGVQAVVLFLGLWIMIKVQKLNYSFLGLLATAALASVITTVLDHFAGTCIVLFFCILKLTQAETVDVWFTIIVGYAVMFCINLFLLGALIGDLRPSARDTEFDLALPEVEAREMATPNRVTATATGDPGTAPKPLSNKNPAPATASSISTAGKANRPSVSSQIANSFSLKGVVHGAKPMAMINTGVKTYTIVPGESISMKTAKGSLTVRCEEIGQKRVSLDVEGERLLLAIP